MFISGLLHHDRQWRESETEDDYCWDGLPGIFCHAGSRFRKRNEFMDRATCLRKSFGLRDRDRLSCTAGILFCYVHLLKAEKRRSRRDHLPKCLSSAPSPDGS